MGIWVAIVKIGVERGLDLERDVRLLGLGIHLGSRENLERVMKRNEQTWALTNPNVFTPMHQ